jgi:hypothetical protein
MSLDDYTDKMILRDFSLAHKVVNHTDFPYRQMCLAVECAVSTVYVQEISHVVDPYPIEDLIPHFFPYEYNEETRSDMGVAVAKFSSDTDFAPYFEEPEEHSARAISPPSQKGDSFLKLLYAYMLRDMPFTIEAPVETYIRNHFEQLMGLTQDLLRTPKTTTFVHYTKSYITRAFIISKIYSDMRVPSELLGLLYNRIEHIERAGCDNGYTIKILLACLNKQNISSGLQLPAWERH